MNKNGNISNGSQKRAGVGCSDSALDRSELMNKIRAHSFAKTETELYLDGHPEAMPALLYYKDLCKALGALVEEYEAKYGPLTATSAAGDRWTWIDGAWPWQNEEDL